jgi:hypothetical protein
MAEGHEGIGLTESKSKNFKAGENEYAGLVTAAENSESTAEKELEPGDVEALKQKTAELYGIDGIQHGLERTIIMIGLQTMADRYGADRLLDAMKASDNDEVASMSQVVERLAPDKNERTSLYAAIEAEPMDVLGRKFNQTLGGVSSGVGAGTDAMERGRRFGIEDVKQGKQIEGENLLLTSDLDKLLINNPQLVENFRQTNDTLAFVKDIRDIYELKRGKYAADLEKINAKIESLVTRGEAAVTELIDLSAAISTDELTRLEERMGASTIPDAQTMIRDLIGRRMAEAQSTREEFAQKLASVRTNILSDFGAEHLAGLNVQPLINPEPIYNTNIGDVE